MRSYEKLVPGDNGWYPVRVEIDVYPCPACRGSGMADKTRYCENCEGGGTCFLDQDEAAEYWPTLSWPYDGSHVVDVTVK